jgi:hypothetical protein
MTPITLQPGESVTVTAASVIEPPVDPDPPPPPPPPPPLPTNLYDISFATVFGVPLSVGSTWYPNVLFRNIKAAGTSMRIVLPRVTERTKLKISDVENTFPSSNYIRYGVLSNRRDFNSPLIDDHTWGNSGGAWMYVYPKDAGRVVYFNHRMKFPEDRYEPWFSTLQASFR